MITRDYYPFGMPMPGLNTDGGYRYAYQGQEKDDETGMEAFELRLWDSRIGRWLTTDPAGQYASPYLGMGNNPISRVDPDGGSDCPDPPCNKNVVQLEGFTGTQYTNKRAWTTEVGLSGTNMFYGMDRFDGTLSEYNVYTGQNFKTHDGANIWFNNLVQSRLEKEWRTFDTGIDPKAIIIGTLGTPIIIIGGLNMAPYLISTEFWAGKAIVSATTQAIINDGDVDVADVGFDTVLLPGVSPLFRGVFDVSSKSGTVEVYGFGNKSTESFAIEVGTGYFGYGLGARISPALSTIESNTAEGIARIMINLNYSAAAKGLNKKLQIGNGN